MSHRGLFHAKSSLSSSSPHTLGVTCPPLPLLISPALSAPSLCLTPSLPSSPSPPLALLFRNPGLLCLNVQRPSPLRPSLPPAYTHTYTDMYVYIHTNALGGVACGARDDHPTLLTVSKLARVSARALAPLPSIAHAAAADLKNPAPPGVAHAT